MFVELENDDDDDDKYEEKVLFLHLKKLIISEYNLLHVQTPICFSIKLLFKRYIPWNIC